MKNKEIRTIIKKGAKLLALPAVLVALQGCAGMNPYYYDPYYTRGYVNYPYPMPQQYPDAEGEYVGPNYGEHAETKIPEGAAPQGTVYQNPNVHPQYMHAPSGYPHPYARPMMMHPGMPGAMKGDNRAPMPGTKQRRFLDELMSDRENF